MPEPFHPEPVHPDPLGRHELKKSVEMREELEYREKSSKAMYEAVAKFIGSGDPGQKTPSQLGASILQEQFGNVTMKTKLLGIAREASTKLFMPENHVFTTISGAQKPVELLQKVLSTRGGTSFKAASAILSLLAFAGHDPSAGGKLDRGRLFLGTQVENTRLLNSLGGVDTIRFGSVFTREQIDTIRQSKPDSEVMKQFVGYLSQHDAVLMKDWVSWPDWHMWTAVNDMVQNYPVDSVFVESTTLMNMITHTSPMSTEIEQPDALKRVLDITVEAMAKGMDSALADKAPVGEAYKRAVEAAFESLRTSWPAKPEDQIMYPDLEGIYPSRQTASRAMIVAGAMTAEKYGIKPDV